ncbi:MAG: CotH kinase family protein, partial [Bacteroidales bacterium]|nr:CotH kinase family protein [Bacteroidales bacterium]
MIIFGIFLSAASFTQDNHKICINEFLASNVSINADIVDFDDYSDWIELYNNESFDTDIGGFYITDNPGNPCKWKFPAGTVIGAKGFLRIWADGYDDTPGTIHWRSWTGMQNERLYYSTDYHHLNFSLSRAGEYIALFDPDGLLVDSVSFGLQQRDVSMGRKPDGSATWFYFGEPTPEAPNDTEAMSNVEFSGNPAIDPGSGFYAGNQAIQINSGTPGSVIRYTMDGSKPIHSSESYEAPVEVAKTTVVSARIFGEGILPGNSVSQTYFIDEEISLPIISITTPPEAFWDEFNGIYPKRMKEREIPVNFEFFRTSDGPEFSIKAGLRLTGQASLYYPQVSFTIHARDRYGTDEIKSQVFPQRELNSFKSLYLRTAGVPDHRSTFFRDALQHSLIINKLDIDCQAYLPSVVFLNGNYWGIYNIRDKINANYLASIHGLNPDDIDLLEYEGSVVPTVMSGDAKNYNLFYEYIQNADLADEEQYRHLESWMEMDEYINYQVCEIYYDNVFWPDQNIRMWRERKEDGKWRWIFFDSDFGFGMPNQISSGYRNNTLEHATSSGTSINSVPAWSTLIFRTLLLNPEFKTKFIQRFSAYMNSIFHPDTVVSLIDQMQEKLSPEMPRHIERWRGGEFYYGYPIPNYSAWLNNVEVMRNFAKNRPGYMRQHINDFFGLEGTFVLHVAIENPGMGSVFINEVEDIDKNSTGIYFRGIPLVLKAIPGVGYRFVKWEGVEADSLNPVNLIPDADTVIIRAIFDTASIHTVPSGIISDTLFTRDHSPYYATGDIIVDSGSTLRIEEGVSLLMPEQASILVYGRLRIEGTEAFPVTIGPNEYSGSWGSLCFVNTTDSSVIRNLKITGATHGHDFARDRAAISGYHADFSLENVIVENVAAPVSVQYGKVLVRGCKLSSNALGDLINMKGVETAIVENCELSGNDCYDSDAIDFDHVSNGIIRGNRIYNIYGYNSDAIDLGEGSKDILIEGNIIYNISDKGISIGNGSTAIIRRNLIANCGQGAGVKDFESYGYIEHNTFYANHFGIACFEKNIGSGGGHACVVNSIFANSRCTSVLTDGLSGTNISYSLFDTDPPSGEHNLAGDPKFLNNLRPGITSPAINSGNPSLSSDPDGTLPDMGAIPFDPKDQENLVINEIHYNPAEGGASEFIEILNAGISPVQMSQYQLSGDIQYTFPDENIEAGEYFLVSKNKDVYDGQGYKVFQWENGELRDGPGSIILQNNQGDDIDFINYDSRFWWPREPDGRGPSLELRHPGLENMVSSNWRSSYNHGGTPGAANNSVKIEGIYINEFLAGNSSVYADENGDYADWIEFYNSNDKPVNLGGLYITDNLDKPLKHQIPIYAQELTTVPAHGFILFWADGQTDQGALHLNFKLAKEGEQIGLAQQLENETVFIDSLNYSVQTADVSRGRYPDGSDHWYDFYTPTPLLGNELTTVQNHELLPEEIALFGNYPNPFHSQTMIRY